MTPIPGSPQQSSAAIDSLADDVAAVVRGVPGVYDLHPGTFGAVATYLPGRRVIGVRLRDGGIEVDVVLTWGTPVLATAEAVRRAVQTLVPGPVDVVVQDVVDPSLLTPAHPEPVPIPAVRPTPADVGLPEPDPPEPLTDGGAIGEPVVQETIATDQARTGPAGTGPVGTGPGGASVPRSGPPRPPAP